MVMEEVETFIRSQPTRKFTKDNILIYQGEVPRGLYAIRSGYVKVYDLSDDGNEQVVGLSGKFDFLPSELLFSKEIVAQYFYAAFTPVEVYVVDRDKLAQRINRDADVLYRIAQTINNQYSGLRRHLTAVQKPKAREKIIYLLHFLSSYFADNENLSGPQQRVAIPLTQQDIANLVGVTRETAAHELKQLKNAGFIDYDKSVFAVNETLEQLIS